MFEFIYTFYWRYMNLILVLGAVFFLAAESDKRIFPFQQATQKRMKFFD